MSAFHLHADDLVLFFYGEARRPERIERHLASCDACRREYQQLVATLAAIPLPAVPERGELYGLEVWQRVRQELPLEGPGRVWWRRWSPLRLGAAAAALVVAAFFAGRQGAPSPSRLAPIATVTLTSNTAERARVAAVVEHLERSERLLLDVANSTSTSLDFANEQRWAEELIDTNRLYRESARLAGDASMAGVLDDLERALLDIVHTPATLSGPSLAAVSARVDAAALVFKVRILSHELRDREAAPNEPRKTT
jgi:hypothetical protein